MDNFLLSLAVECKADYVVSGEYDLLILQKIKSTKIMNWKEFIKEILKRNISNIFKSIYNCVN